MSAVSEHELSEHDFIGQVFTKASPILTWRPAKVSNAARITPSLPVDRRGADGGLADRFSRAPTRRVVAWPVLKLASSRPSVMGLTSGSRGRALRALLTLIGFSLLCGSALTLCVYVVLGEAPGLEHAKLSSVRVGTAHVAEASFDTLLQPGAPAPAIPVAPPVPLAAPQPHHTSGAIAAAPHARPHRGPSHKWRRTARVASHGT